MIMGFICSEAIDKLYKKLGYDILPDESECYTSPGDLANSDQFSYCGTVNIENDN